MHRQGHESAMLIVDDDELNCDILSNIFESEHKILTAHDGREGLAEVERNGRDICAILLDVMMPVMDGMEMLAELAAMGVPDNIPVFLITGETDGRLIRKAYDLGVMDVINKPITPHIVLRRVHSVMELFAARDHFSEKVDEQTAELKRRAVELEQKNMLLAQLNLGMIEALATATEFRSEESGAHVRRIHDITLLFLRETPLSEKFSEEESHLIARAAILHDVGKISVPDAILNKPGRLTSEEFEIMKQHTSRGDELLTRIPQLKSLPFYDYARIIARHHHERWDGRGYPDGLVGDATPVYAQVVALADVYDALVSDRVYKPAFEHPVAMEMIGAGKCGAFSPLLLEYFKNLGPVIKRIYEDNRENGAA